MIVNYEEHGFEITAETLPEACTACPFYGYSVETDTAICGITLNDIRTDGPQDEERERDCPIKERKAGKWIEHSFSEDGKARLIECSECGAAYVVNCLCDYSIFVEERKYCNKCGAKMSGGEHDV